MTLFRSSCYLSFVLLRKLDILPHIDTSLVESKIQIVMPILPDFRPTDDLYLIRCTVLAHIVPRRLAIVRLVRSMRVFRPPMLPRIVSQLVRRAVLVSIGGSMCRAHDHGQTAKERRFQDWEARADDADVRFDEGPDVAGDKIPCTISH